MSQQELLDVITNNDGILQKDVIRKYGKDQHTGGTDAKMLLQLVKKGCVTRTFCKVPNGKKWARTYALYATGEQL